MDPDDIAIGIIAGLLEARTGQKLTEDRRWRIAPALAGLFRDRGISSNQDLVVLLTQPDESSLAQEVVEALLNNETYFFRDRQIFDFFSDATLAEMAAKRAAERRLSIWCVGCSTGQETLSVAMTFAPAALKTLAIARPMPPAPPVMKATWPSRLAGPLKCCATTCSLR